MLFVVKPEGDALPLGAASKTLAGQSSRQWHTKTFCGAQLEDVLDALVCVPLSKLRKRSSAGLGPKFS